MEEKDLAMQQMPFDLQANHSKVMWIHRARSKNSYLYGETVNKAPCHRVTS